MDGKEVSLRFTWSHLNTLTKFLVSLLSAMLIRKCFRLSIAAILTGRFSEQHNLASAHPSGVAKAESLIKH